jgi:hypothetical protein
MDIELKYPIYALKLSDRYYCLPGEEDGTECFGLPLFTDRATAEEFGHEHDLEFAVMTFSDEHELRRLLETLVKPKPDILLDPVEQPDGSMIPTWAAEADALLHGVLPEVGFAFNYPQYAIRVGNYFATLPGSKPTGERLSLAMVFTDHYLAEDYIHEYERGATLEPINDQPAFLKFVESLLPQTDGIILDYNPKKPAIGKHCIMKEVLVNRLAFKA